MSTLLVMEDDKSQADAWSILLSEASHQVLLAENGDDAFRIALSTPIDLVATDIVVKNDGSKEALDGMALVSCIRAAAGSPEAPWLDRLPIVVLSGAFATSTMQIARDTVKKLGANAMLEKPVSHSQFLATIEELLATRATTTLDQA